MLGLNIGKIEDAFGLQVNVGTHLVKKVVGGSMMTGFVVHTRNSSFEVIRYARGTGTDSHLVECDSLLSLHFQNLLAFERQLLWFLVVVNLSIISVSTGVGNTKA